MGKILQREAYPVFNLIAAKKAMEHITAPVCVFSLNGMTVGQLFIPDVSDEEIVIHYHFSAPHLRSNPTLISIKTKTVPNPLDRSRRFAYCPICSHVYASLYYTDTWGCSSCHGLHYRRQLVDKAVLKWERLDELTRMVGRGRPKGMHNETYAELRNERFRLQYTLQGRSRKYASEEHDLAVKADWVAGSDVDFWAPEYRIRDGKFVARPDW